MARSVAPGRLTTAHLDAILFLAAFVFEGLNPLLEPHFRAALPAERRRGHHAIAILSPSPLPSTKVDLLLAAACPHPGPDPDPDPGPDPNPRSASSSLQSAFSTR